MKRFNLKIIKGRALKQNAGKDTVRVELCDIIWNLHFFVYKMKLLITTSQVFVSVEWDCV